MDHQFEKLSTLKAKPFTNEGCQAFLQPANSICTQLVDDLIQLGADGTEAQKFDLFDVCKRKLNSLRAPLQNQFTVDAYGGTVEDEFLVEWFQEAGLIAGLCTKENETKFWEEIIDSTKLYDGPVLTNVVSHDLFGMLKRSENIKDYVDLEGTISVAGRPACKLHITGSNESTVEEILDWAAEAHRTFLEREPEIRAEAVKLAIPDSWISDLSKEKGEKVTREQVIEAFKTIMVINYFTESDEVSIYFVDGSGWFCHDVNLVSNFAFTDLDAGIDG